MLATTLSLISCAVTVTAWPFSLFGHTFGAPESKGTPMPLSLTTVNSTLLRPAQFARAAYCSGASLESWSCGLPCDQVNGVKFLQAGGDQGSIPFYFIAHDPEQDSIVVAHEGTDPNKILSLVNDVEFLLDDIDESRFPRAAGQGIKVHTGFQSTFERTADGILSGVQTALLSTGASNVLVTGHSLGPGSAGDVDGKHAARIARPIRRRDDLHVWDATREEPGVANFVDSNVSPAFVPADVAIDEVAIPGGVTFMTIQHDPVPNVPPLLFDFAHPSEEIHVVDSSQRSIVCCPGQDNENCISGNSLFDISIGDHLGVLKYFPDIPSGLANAPEILLFNSANAQYFYLEQRTDEP
ncbi:unnamed protein product [Mycena citricolor]|uniref:Fungal lipase-type domain-containing protein n=1 Tax=Mycena citricolor TaxID=2018698 RepID=A0AAD2K3N2_9AGAR|nr:unnamed protein product [Mycena citricolor]